MASAAVARHEESCIIPRIVKKCMAVGVCLLSTTAFDSPVRFGLPFMYWDSSRVFFSQTLVSARHSFKSFLMGRRRRIFCLLGQRGSSDAIKLAKCHGFALPGT